MAERVDLRLFLSMGMLFSGIFTMAFGMAYYWGIHTIAYFLLVQVNAVRSVVVVMMVMVEEEMDDSGHIHGYVCACQCRSVFHV